MSRPVEIYLDPGRPYYEIAAAMLAAMAYPNDATACRRFSGALLCTAIEGMLKHKTDSPSTAMEILYEMRDRKRVAREIEAGLVIIKRERRIAATAFQPVIMAAICDTAGIPRPSTFSAAESQETLESLGHEIAAARSKKGRKSPSGTVIEPRNFVRRILKPSKPAIHIFTAFDLILKKTPEFCDLNGINLCGVLLRESLAFRIVNLAEEIRPLIGKTIGIAEAEQARVIFASKINKFN